MSARRPKPEAMERFNEALRSVLRVSKTDLSRMLEEERRSKIGKLKPGPKPKTSGRAASDRD